MILNPKAKVFGRTIGKLVNSKESFILLCIWTNVIFVISSVIMSIVAVANHTPGLLVYLPFVTAIVIWFNYEFFTSKKKVLFDYNFKSKFVSNTFETLAKAQSKYYQNIEAAPVHLRDKVELDSKEFDQYCWDLASDMYDFNNFIGNRELTNGQIQVFQEPIQFFKDEVNKVEEMVKNLVSISVVEVREKIKTKYSLPSTADNLSAVSKIRLQGKLELTSGTTNTNQLNL